MIERVSIPHRGSQANGASRAPSVSADGRFVAFASSASNLVTGDTNRVSDVFVRDRLRRTTERVSVGAGGRQANGSSYNPAISADGRTIAFVSEATNLGESTGIAQVYVHDTVTGATTLVSRATGGAPANGRCTRVSISGDGRWVAFDSLADNLVAGDTNQASDVFAHDRATGQTMRVSVGGDADSDSPSISADGRCVAFRSFATSLVPNDQNLETDVFVRDLQAGTTTRVSVGPRGMEADGASGEPSISGDGRFVAFDSYAQNLTGDVLRAPLNVFVHDRAAGRTDLVSANDRSEPGNSGSAAPSISADGRFIAFESHADNLEGRDRNRVADVFMRDRVRAETERVSLTADGDESNGDSHRPAVAGDGSTVAFMSLADNLVPRDTNDAFDVFAAAVRCGSRSAGGRGSRAR